MRCCILIDCPAAPYDSSTTDLDTSTAQQYYFIGDNITYRCKSNHSLVSGNLTRTCLDNGSWSGKQPVCRSEKGICSKRLNLTISYLFLGRNQINHQVLMLFSSPVPKAQVSFSDQNLSVVVAVSLS